MKGYFLGNKWHHIHCKDSTEESHRICLRGKHIIITGDSTTRAWYVHLMNQIDCNLTTPKWIGQKRYTRSICESKSKKLRIEWVPHAMPFTGYESFNDIHSIPKVLEGIDNTTETVILIHMYYHLVSFHHSIFKQRMSIISKSVARLIKVNRHVTVFIKGPASCHQKCNNEYVNDYYGHIYNDIIYQAFSGLHDKVIFLNMRDMTIAKKTPDIHPPDDEVREAVHQIFDYLCKPLH